MVQDLYGQQGIIQDGQKVFGQPETNLGNTPAHCLAVEILEKKTNGAKRSLLRHDGNSEGSKPGWGTETVFGMGYGGTLCLHIGKIGVQKNDGGGMVVKQVDRRDRQGKPYGQHQGDMFSSAATGQGISSREEAHRNAG